MEHLEDYANDERDDSEKKDPQPPKWKTKEKVEEQYLSASEVATILGVTRHTVYKLEKAKRIFGIRIGGIWRFPKRDFDQLLTRLHRESRERTSF